MKLMTFVTSPFLGSYNAVGRFQLFILRYTFWHNFIVTGLVRQRNSNRPVRPIERLAWAHAMYGKSSLFITFCSCHLSSVLMVKALRILVWHGSVWMPTSIIYHHRAATEQIKWGRLQLIQNSNQLFLKTYVLNSTKLSEQFKDTLFFMLGEYCKKQQSGFRILSLNFVWF